ncbi:MAG: hypothetical protein WCF85_15200 [Rhodospirillaceae bacterium]
MPTQPVGEFEIEGRAFIVLWKPTAAYLRADGHMWGDSLGADLTPEEACRRARARAEMMIFNERCDEERLAHLLYQRRPPSEVSRMMGDYTKLIVEFGQSSFPTLWAAFNLNSYVCLAEGWRFCGSAATAEAALANALAFVTALPEERRHPGRPDKPSSTGKTRPGRKPYTWRLPMACTLALAVVTAIIATGAADGRVTGLGSALGFLGAVIIITLIVASVLTFPLCLVDRNATSPATGKTILALLAGAFVLALALIPAAPYLGSYPVFPLFSGYVALCYGVMIILRLIRRLPPLSSQ